MTHSPYRLFLQNLRRYRGYYLSGILALLLTSLTEVLLPKFIQWSLDLLTSENANEQIPAFFIAANRGQTLNVLVSALVGVLILGWIGRVGWRQILARQSHLAGHEVKTRMWNILKDQPLSLLERYSLGDLMNRATADWNKIRFIHGFTLVTAFDLIFFTILSVTSMLMIHPQLALLCLLMIPFLPRRIIRISRREYQQHQFAQVQLSHLSEIISQALKTIRLQRATASEGIWLDKLNREAEVYAARQFEVLNTGWRIFIWGALPCIFAYGILFTFGVTKIQAGELSIGAFIALQSYVLLLQTPLFELGSVISEWQTGFASYQRITELYDLEEKISPTPDKLISEKFQPELALELQSVSFSYDGKRNALRDVSLTLPRGEKLGLLGPIGSGKSSLIHLVAGLLPIEQGSARIHGLPLGQSGRDWLTQQITLVSQKPFLFAGTIRYNLSPDGRCSEKELEDVLQCVELWDDIDQFPAGLDSWIGEWGINLSGGQKQRLALARALLKPAPILLIDDGLSAVDSLTEARILERLDRRLGQQTMIWAAHRASTLQLCHRILRMEDGQLLEGSLESQPSGALGFSSQLHLLPCEV